MEHPCPFALFVGVGDLYAASIGYGRQRAIRDWEGDVFYAALTANVGNASRSSSLSSSRSNRLTTVPMPLDCHRETSLRSRSPARGLATMARRPVAAASIQKFSRDMAFHFHSPQMTVAVTWVLVFWHWFCFFCFMGISSGIRGHRKLGQRFRSSRPHSLLIPTVCRSRSRHSCR